MLLFTLWKHDCVVTMALSLVCVTLFIAKEDPPIVNDPKKNPWLIPPFLENAVDL